MNTKLTLSLEEKIIKKARLYARKHNRSISEIVSAYLNTLEQPNSSKSDVNIWANELIGSKRTKTTDQIIKENYLSYLEEKYK